MASHTCGDVIAAAASQVAFVKAWRSDRCCFYGAPWYSVHFCCSEHCLDALVCKPVAGGLSTGNSSLRNGRPRSATRP